MSGSTSGEDHKLVVKAELQCRNQCGYFGNPEWDGYCSKCYKEVNTLQKRQKDYHKNRKALQFDKFEDKRKQQADRRSSTLRSALFGRGSGTESHHLTPSRSASGTTLTGASPTQTGTPQRVKHQQQHQHHHQPRRSLSPDSHSCRDKFLVFLKQCPKPVAQELSRISSSAVEQISMSSHRYTVDELSDMVQDLYNVVEQRLCRISAMSDCKFSIKEAQDRVEEYVCVRAYHILFCPNSDEEVADLSLQDRIRSLHWVSNGRFLETILDFTVPGVRDQIDLAITEIIDVNSHREISEKLACVVRCAKAINQALQLSAQGKAAGADELLPGLIYVVLKGNPPLLQSNVQYIRRFALHSKVEEGETGYYFTNLHCAMRFVQNLNADSLKMPREEFEAYTSGQLVPPMDEANSRCHEAIKSMRQTIARLEDIRDRQAKLAQAIVEFQEHTKRETDACLELIRIESGKYPPPMTIEEKENELQERFERIWAEKMKQKTEECKNEELTT